MNGSTAESQTAAEEQQWLAARFPERSPADTLRRAQFRRAALVIAVIVVAGLIGGVAGAGVFGSDPGPGHDPPAWRQVMGLALIFAGVVVEFVGIARLAKRGLTRANWRSPLLALSIRERRRILRQMRGSIPQVAEDAPLVRGHAQRIARQQPLLLVWGGLVVLQSGQMLNTHGATVWFFAVASIAMVIAGAFFARDLGAARRYLDQNPEAPAEPAL